MISLIDTFSPRICYLLFGANKILVMALLVGIFGFLYWLFEKKSISKKWLLFLAALPVVLYLLRHLLNDYFLSDDFDHFVVVNKFSYPELFVDGLLANGVWAFHRLFVGFWLFKFIYSIFGANYEAFMLFNFLLHLVNFCLFYKILKRISQNKYSVFFTLFVFGFFYLSWISNIHELVAATLLLVAFRLLVAKIIDKKDTLTITAGGLVAYFLAVSSKEVTFLLPLVFTLFLVSFSHYKKRIKLKEAFRKLTPFYLIGLFYLIVFVADYLGFTGFEKGSGYRAEFLLSRVIENFSLYLDHRIGLFSPLLTLAVVTAVTLFVDWYRKKPVLTPLYLSYLALLLPVSLLEKFEPYYSYIPSFFLFSFALIYTELAQNLISKKIKGKFQLAFKVLLASFALVFIFGVDKNLQDVCYFLQYPRPHARRVAVEKAVTRVEKALARGETSIDLSSEASEEMAWFLFHGYIKYFLKNKKAFNYNYVYCKDFRVLELKNSSE